MGESMKVLLFSDKKTTIQQFAPIERSKTYSLSVHTLSELKEIVKSEGKEDLYYLDVTGMEDNEREKVLRYLKKQWKEKGLCYAVVDGKDALADPAALFHDGAVDYIGKDLLKEKISTKRINAVVEYIADTANMIEESTKAGTKIAGTKSNYILSGPGWKKVKAGKEYTFCFMYAELDLHSDWQKKSGKLHLDKVGTEFHSLIEKTVAPLEGKIWMWNDFSGVVLLPFDGSSCDALLSAFRLILNRSIISTELFRYQILMSYRIALEIGNTVYHPRGNTGTVISDTVNFLFHLGKKFAKPGNLYLTDAVTPYIPEGLKACFLPAGAFEGREITRMLLPME